MQPPLPLGHETQSLTGGSVSSRNSGASAFPGVAAAAPPLSLADSLVASRKSNYDASTAASRERARSASQQRERIGSRSSHAVAELASDMAHSPQQQRRRSIAASKIMKHTQPINDHLTVTHASGRTAAPAVPRSRSRRSSAASSVALRQTASRASSRASSRPAPPTMTSTQESKSSAAAPPSSSSQRLFERNQLAAKRSRETHEAQIQALMQTMRHLPSNFRSAMLSSHTPGSASYAVVAAAIARVEQEHQELQATARRRVSLGPVSMPAGYCTAQPGSTAPPPPSNRQSSDVSPSSPPAQSPTARQRHAARRPSTASAISRVTLASDGPTPRHADSLHTHVHRMADAAVAKSSAAAPTWVTGSNWTPAVTAPQPFALSTSNKRRPVVRASAPKRTSARALDRLFRGKSSVPISASTKGVQGAFPSPAEALKQAQKRMGPPATHRRQRSSTASTHALSEPAAGWSAPLPDELPGSGSGSPLDAFSDGSDATGNSARGGNDGCAPSLDSSVSSVPSLHGVARLDAEAGADQFLSTAPSSQQSSLAASAALVADREQAWSAQRGRQQVTPALAASASNTPDMSVPSTHSSPGPAPPAGSQPAANADGTNSILDDILNSAVFAM